MANSRSSSVPGGSDDGLRFVAQGHDQLSHLLRNIIKPLYDEPELHTYNDVMDAFERILKITERKETEQ